MKIDIFERKERFRIYVHPLTLLTASISTIIGFAGLFYDKPIVFIVLSIITVVSLSIRNWYYIQTFDRKDLENDLPLLNTFWSLAWIILTTSLAISQAFESGLFSFFGGQQEFIRYPILLLTNTGLSLINLFIPKRWRAEEERLLRAESFITNRDRFEDLRTRHYRLLRQPVPDWDDNNLFGNLSTDRLWELKQLEALAVYRFERFAEEDAKPAGLSTFLRSVTYAFFLSVPSEIVAGLLLKSLE